MLMCLDGSNDGSALWVPALLCGSLLCSVAPCSALWLPATQEELWVSFALTEPWLLAGIWRGSHPMEDLTVLLPFSFSFV